MSRKYNKLNPSQEGILGFREIAEEMEISPSSAYSIYYNGLKKIGTHVFRTFNGRDPTPEELSNITTNESFQDLLAQVLAEKK